MHDLRSGPDRNVEERMHVGAREELLQRIQNGEFKSPRPKENTQKTDLMKRVERKFDRFGKDIKEILEYFSVTCGIPNSNLGPLLGVSESTVWSWMKEFRIPIQNSAVVVPKEQPAIGTDLSERLRAAGRLREENPHLCGMPEPIKHFCSKCLIKECSFNENKKIQG